MNPLKKFKEKYMQSNFSLIILSLIIAVCLWLFIALTQYPSVQKTIAHIPVTTDISGSLAGQNGLRVISCSVPEVTVEVTGSRTQIGNLTNEGLEAYFDSDNISSVGTKSLSLKLRNSSGIRFDIKSINPSNATVVFDKIETREFPISPKTPNVSVVDGKYLNPDATVCDPDMITISGPSAQLDKISSVYAVSNKEMSLESSYSLPSDEVQLYTTDNVLIDQSSLKLENSNFDIRLIVRTQRTVGLTVRVVDAPSTFNKENLKFKLSTESVTLASNSNQTEIPPTIDIGVVSITELKPGFVKQFSLDTQLENTDLINLSALETVTVTLDDTDLTQKELSIDNSRITISNIPDPGYEYTVITSLMDITVVGSEESIKEITAEDIIADVSLLNTTISSNQFNCNVTFSCPKYDDVWIITNSKASIKKERKTPEKTVAPTNAAT